MHRQFIFPPPQDTVRRPSCWTRSTPCRSQDRLPIKETKHRVLARGTKLFDMGLIPRDILNLCALRAALENASIVAKRTITTFFVHCRRYRDANHAHFVSFATSEPDRFSLLFRLLSSERPTHFRSAVKDLNSETISERTLGAACGANRQSRAKCPPP